eukprot:12351785-Alexandrium_andersonii.AAC.1
MQKGTPGGVRTVTYVGVITTRPSARSARGCHLAKIVGRRWDTTHGPSRALRAWASMLPTTVTCTTS